MKRINFVLLVVLVVSLFGASAAFAQEPPADAPPADAPADAPEEGQRNRRGNFGQLISETLDLDEETVREAFENAPEDATLADIITSLGGDPTDFEALLTERFVENGGDAEDAGERVDELLNTPRNERQQNQDGEAGQGQDGDGQRPNRGPRGDNGGNPPAPAPDGEAGV